MGGGGIFPWDGAADSINSGFAEAERLRKAREHERLQENLRSRSLDMGSHSDIGTLDFSQLDDPKAAAALSARRDTILSERRAPGRSQTIISNRTRMA